MIHAPGAALGASDPTRRYAVREGDRVLLPGLTRSEAEAACTWLAALDPVDHPLALAQVVLPVVLTDGAGPYLVDASGALVLALGPHPGIAGANVAMGARVPGHAVGLVRRIGPAGWAWLARAEVGEADRVVALDALHALSDLGGLVGWATEWAGITPADVL